MAQSRARKDDADGSHRKTGVRRPPSRPCPLPDLAVPILRVRGCWSLAGSLHQTPPPAQALGFLRLSRPLTSRIRSESGSPGPLQHTLTAVLSALTTQASRLLLGVPRCQAPVPTLIPRCARVFTSAITQHSKWISE